jgi:thiol-disulfide isomerase/thioredoxin
MARVATVELNGEAVAYPYTVLQKVNVVNDTVGGTPIAVLWQSGTASALDSGVVAEGRDVGTVHTFSRELDRQTLTFRYDGERIVDDRTGSEWTVLGKAVDGQLAGKALMPVVNVNHFWFSWAAFRPETRIYRVEESSTAAPAAAPEAIEVDVDFDFELGLYQGEDELGKERIQFSEIFAQSKPVVVNMWAGLCPTCRAELPVLQEAYEKHGDQVSFVGVDIGPFTGLGFEPEGRSLLAELGITFPAGGTTEAAIMREYRILGVPATLFFSPSGEIIDHWAGLLTEGRLEQSIQSLLSK